MTAIRVEELLNRKVGRFLNHRSEKWNSDPSLKQVLGEVRSPHWKELVKQIRDVESKIDNASSSVEKKELKIEKSKLKSKLAAVTVSGLGHRKLNTNKKEPSFVHSGLLQIDLDRKDHEQLTSAEIIELLKNDPHILACFLSPSGGVKGICAISQNEDDHLGSFLAAEKHFKEMGLTIDALPKNKKSLCYLSHDPNPYIATGGIELIQPIEVPFEHVDTNTQSPNNTITQSPNNTEEYIRDSLLEKVRVKGQIKERVEEWRNGLDPEKDKGLLENWELIEQRYTPMLGNRNHDLCDLIAYSTCRFSKEVSLGLAKLMRELWDPVYNDSMDQHMYEANKQWAACEYSFRAILTDLEREIYEALNEPQRCIFRICRGLSLHENKRTEVGEFFLSCRELGKRLGVSHEKANRMLYEFSEELQLIKLIENGKAAGRKASMYKWNL